MDAALPHVSKGKDNHLNFFSSGISKIGDLIQAATPGIKKLCGVMAILLFLFSSPSWAGSIGPLNSVSAADASALELVIIDPAVETRYLLASRVKPGRKVFVLTEDLAAIDQITKILNSYRNLSAIHLITHGAPGELAFSNDSITLNGVDSLPGRMAMWGRALHSTGDILLYGCDVGAGSSGTQFIQAMAAATGADVAASTDKTGHASVNADLDFEIATGNIEAHPAISPNINFGPLFTFDWTTEGWSPSGTSSMPRSYSDVDGSGVDFEFNITDTNNRYQSGSPDINNAPGNDALRNVINLANQSESVSITISFSEPIYIDDLTIMDLDRSRGRFRWHDRVQVTGTAGGTVINPSGINAGSNVGVSGGNTVFGNATYLTPGDPSGWAVFSFQDQQVDSITIVYGSGNQASSNPDASAIWIGDIESTIPTHAVISSFFADTENGQVGLNWTTASEVGTVGFHLQRLEETTGKYIRINDNLLPGLLHSPQGGHYRYVDATAETGNDYTYKLIEVEASGNRRSYGPFSVGVTSPNPNSPVLDPSLLTRRARGSGYSRLVRENAASEKETIAARDLFSASFPAATNTPAGRLKIEITKSALYYLEVEEIAASLGQPSEKIAKWIKRKKLRLINQGQPVAWLAAEENAGIYFYGEKISSHYTDRNIYWLEKGKGTVMRIANGHNPDPGTGYETFTENRHEEENRWALTGLFDDPEDDYWLWDFIISGDPDQGSKAFTLSANGAAESESAVLTIRLKGATATSALPDHHVTIALNGTTIGEGEWDGTAVYDLTLTFDGTLLIDGDNTVTVTGLLDSGAEYSIFYVDSMDLAYQRFYQAVNDRLWVNGDDNEVVTVGGFSSDQIQVFDVTNPWKVRRLKGLTIDGIEDNYRVSFTPVSANSLYLVIADTAIGLSPDLIPDEPSTLQKKKNRADYVIIAPKVMTTAAQRLADYRAGQGFDSLVVDVDDIYDAFNYGIAHPEAIHDFLVYAWHNWKTRPRLVVLAGEGHYDYLDNQGHGNNLVPPIMVSTPHGLFASDNRYADVTGFDGVPDIGIGRLPVATVEELDALIDKIIAYENAAGGDWTGKILMLADNPDDGGNFPDDSDAVAELIPTDLTTEKIYLSEVLIEEARQQVLDGINAGALVVNHLGHAGMDRLTQEGLLTADDVSDLDNEERLPLFTAMTCLVGRFEIPGFGSLGEVLVQHGQGGGIAVWAPGGLSMNSQAKLINQMLFTTLFNENEKILGEAVLKTLEKFTDGEDASFLPQIFNLIGDPALRLK